MILKKIKNKIKGKIYPNRINSIVFEPTIKCNLNCKMCYQKNRRLKKDMTKEQAFKVIDILKENKIDEIRLSGGEIFLLPYIDEFLEYIDKKGIFMKIITNGTILPKKLDYNNLTTMIVSIDGLEETHNLIRGKEIYKKVIKNLIKLNGMQFKVFVNMVVVKENIKEIPKLIDLINDYAEKFFIIFEITDRDLEYTYKEMLKLLKDVEHNEKVVIAPSIVKSYSKGYYNKLYPFDIECCTTLTINHQGEVIPCNMFNKSIGNILNKDFKEIVKEFKIWKKELKLKPICNRCCYIKIK